MFFFFNSSSFCSLFLSSLVFPVKRSALSFICVRAVSFKASRLFSFSSFSSFLLEMKSRMLFSFTLKALTALSLSSFMALYRSKVDSLFSSSSTSIPPKSEIRRSSVSFTSLSSCNKSVWLFFFFSIEEVSSCFLNSSAPKEATTSFITPFNFFSSFLILSSMMESPFFSAFSLSISHDSFVFSALCSEMKASSE